MIYGVGSVSLHGEWANIACSLLQYSVSSKKLKFHKQRRFDVKHLDLILCMFIVHCTSKAKHCKQYFGYQDALELCEIKIQVVQTRSTKTKYKTPLSRLSCLKNGPIPPYLTIC